MENLWTQIPKGDHFILNDYPQGIKDLRWHCP